MFETRPAVGAAKFGHYTSIMLVERHSNSLNISEICLKLPAPWLFLDSSTEISLTGMSTQLNCRNKHIYSPHFRIEVKS
jgi:hypothetical protein